MIESIRNRMEREEGFTLIELLVVILIIGILAAVAIPSFLNQREKGQDACAKSQARTMATAMETHYTDTSGYTTTVGGLNDIEEAVTNAGACGNGTVGIVSAAINGTTGNCGTTGSGSGTAYCVSQTSASGRSFAVVKTGTTSQTRYCGANGDATVDATAGGCQNTSANGW